MGIKLRDVVRQYAGSLSAPSVTGGSDETIVHVAPEQPPAIDREALRRDLARVVKSNQSGFVVCVAMLIILFLATLSLVIFNFDKPGLVKAAVSALGVSSAGVVTMMIKLWRNKSNTEMLMILAISMDAQTMRTVIEILAKRL